MLITHTFSEQTLFWKVIRGLWIFHHFVNILGIAFACEVLQDDAKNVREITGKILAFPNTEMGKTRKGVISEVDVDVVVIGLCNYFRLLFHNSNTNLANWSCSSTSLYNIHRLSNHCFAKLSHYQGRRKGGSSICWLLFIFIYLLLPLFFLLLFFDSNTTFWLITLIVKQLFILHNSEQ